METRASGLGNFMILDNDQATVFVAAYEPRDEHREHRDRVARISVLLRGGFAEETRNCSICARPGDVLFKSNTVLHENRFGDDGAVVASIGLKDATTMGDGADNYWSYRRSLPVLRDVVAVFEAAFANCTQSVRASLAALLSHSIAPPRTQRTAPVWLKRLKDDLEDAGFGQVNIQDAAAAAGVHPAHVSRLFRACYGVSITEHAQLHAIRRAMGLLSLPDHSLNHIALTAGFFDQSHMNRVFVRWLGRTPGEVRGLSLKAVGASG